MSRLERRLYTAVLAIVLVSQLAALCAVCRDRLRAGADLRRCEAALDVALRAAQ